MNVSAPIVGGWSKAADPTKKSFLDLSPELRNAVYKLIFEHEHPLFLEKLGDQHGLRGGFYLYRNSWDTEHHNDNLQRALVSRGKYYEVDHPRK